MANGPSGFYNAPITKCIVLGTGMFSLLVSVFGWKKILAITNAHSVIYSFHIWKLFTNNFYFSSPIETVIGLMLLYNFRIFERQMGSLKFAAFTLTTSGIAVLVNLATLVLLSHQEIVSGPYPLIFSALVLFFFEVPPTTRFRFCGISASDKLLTYMFAVQLLFSHSLGSICAGFTGLVAGVAYRLDAVPFKRLAFPMSVGKWFSKWVLPWIQGPPKQNLPRVGDAQNPNAATGLFNVGGAPVNVQPELQPPDEAVITQLVDMGFPREEVMRALLRANNNVMIATNILLDRM